MTASLPPMEPQLLATFLAVAESGGVQAAAQQLGRSQPAVTTRIQRLETTLGTVLFVRSARGMQLTPAGQTLLGYARQMQRLLDEASRALRTPTVFREKLVLAASTTIAAHVLPPILTRFQESYQPSGIVLQIGNTAEVLEWVRSGAILLGLVEGAERARAVHLEGFLQDEIIPVFAPKCPNRGLLEQIAGIKDVTDLATIPFLRREAGSGTRRIIQQALNQAGIPERKLRHVHVIGETTAITQAVQAGLGIAFLSRCSIARELANGDLRPILALATLQITRQFSWAQAGGGLPAWAETFKSFANREVH